MLPGRRGDEGQCGGVKVQGRPNGRLSKGGGGVKASDARAADGGALQRRRVVMQRRETAQDWNVVQTCSADLQTSPRDRSLLSTVAADAAERRTLLCAGSRGELGRAPRASAGRRAWRPCCCDLLVEGGGGRVSVRRVGSPR